jgi:CelD/BcsL family acetyltransferase involved in cellulose biosynthesis
MELRVSTVTTVEGMARLADDWNALLVRAGNELPFLLPEWLCTWWEVFRETGPFIRDSLHFKVLRRSGGEVVAMAPFMRTDRPSFGPVRARSLNFLGADPYITEQCGPVVDPAWGEDAGRALADDLASDPSWDWIAWQGLDRQAPFASALDRGLCLHWTEAETSNVLTLAPTWEELRGRLKRNIKESLRHGYNSLERDGFTPRLEVARTPAQVEEALSTFLRLHGARAALTDTVRHPDHFSDPRGERFLRLVCERLARREVARVFTLFVGGEAVASRIGFALPRCLYFYYSGWDPAWRKYGVMTTALAEAIKYAIAAGIPRVHLSMGQDVSKSRWGPDTPLLHDAICVRPRVRSRAALRLYELGRRRATAGGLLGRILARRA